ncbi:histidinol-phosphatase [Clostridium chrysemydis]|uniref:histidinol-phosphatase n=1 Tax=Clostridium chrysemydis TaxID=2665504 RepID=UPI001883558A|nr:histidinol-phosphatase [Clostridium chrysemydis]
MLNKVNFHTHTSRCLHAKGTDEEYVISAIEKGLDVLGFSDHAPYPDNRYGLRMQYNELDDYMNSILNLKKKYKNKISIKLGLEIEYNKKNLNYYKHLLNDFDYLILGQHITVTKDYPFINNFELTSTKDYIAYAKSISDGLDTGLFKMLAHPDLIFLNKLDFDDNALKSINIIIDAAKRNKTILEFNANGIRAGKFDFPDGYRYRYPYRRFWDIAKEQGLKVIVSSDAHSPEQIFDEATVKAYELAKEWDLNLVYSLE